MSKKHEPISPKQLADIKALAELVINNPDDNPTLLVFIKPDGKSVEFLEVCTCPVCNLNNNKIIGLINSGKMKLQYKAGN